MAAHVNAPRRDPGFSHDANGDSRRHTRTLRTTQEPDAGSEARRLLLGAFMSIATQTSAPTLEPHDAPRVTPPAPRVTEPEVTSEPEPLDAALDNPYDNIACTD